MSKNQKMACKTCINTTEINEKIIKFYDQKYMCVLTFVFSLAFLGLETYKKFVLCLINIGTLICDLEVLISLSGVSVSL